MTRFATSRGPVKHDRRGRAGLLAGLVLAAWVQLAPGVGLGQIPRIPPPPPAAEDRPYLNYSQIAYMTVGDGRTDITFSGDTRLTLNRAVTLGPPPIPVMTTPMVVPPVLTSPPAPDSPSPGNPPSCRPDPAGPANPAGGAGQIPVPVAEAPQGPGFEIVSPPPSESPYVVEFIKLGRTYVNVEQVVYSYAVRDRRYVFFDHCKQPLELASADAGTFTRAIGTHPHFLKMDRAGGPMYVNGMAATHSAEAPNRTHTLYFSGNAPLSLNSSELESLRRPVLPAMPMAMPMALPPGDLAPPAPAAPANPPSPPRSIPTFTPAPPPAPASSDLR